MRRALAPLVVMSALVACNAITGLSNDYTLGGGAGEGGAPDGSDDASVDGAAPDSSVDPSFACDRSDPAVVFCDDFEAARDGSTFGWDREETNGGTIEIAEAGGRAGTRGLRARLGASGGSRKVALWKDITGPFTHLSVRFSMSVVAKSTAYFVIGAFGFTQPGNYRTYGLAAYDSNRLDQSDPPSPANADAFPFTPGTFYAIEVVVERSSLGYSGRLTVDGVVVDTRDDASLGDGTPTKVELGVGAFFTSTGGAGEVIVDDVVVRRL